MVGRQNEISLSLEDENEERRGNRRVRVSVVHEMRGRKEMGRRRTSDARHV